MMEKFFSPEARRGAVAVATAKFSFSQKTIQIVKVCENISRLRLSGREI